MRSGAAVILLLLLFPIPGAAQDARGASAGGSVSLTNMDSRTRLSFGGSFEYRFNRVAGLEVEVTSVPTAEVDLFDGVPMLASPSPSPFAPFSRLLPPSISGILPTIFPPRLLEGRSRAVIFTNNVRVHIPTTIDRVDPYVVAGGGIASVRRQIDFTLPIFSIEDLGGLGLVTPLPIGGTDQIFSSSSTDLALTLGGGAAIRVASRMWIEGDMRLIRLFGSDDRNVGRFGVGLRYRF
jgi:hypothetical protein